MTDLVVVVPTIKGREEPLKAVLDGISKTCQGVDYLITTIQNDNKPCAVAWNEGLQTAMEVDATFVCLASDDRVPIGEWLAEAVDCTERGFLPCPAIWNEDGSIRQQPAESHWKDGDLCEGTSIPFARLEDAVDIGLLPPRHWYSDHWWSAKARSLGHTFKVSLGFEWRHLWGAVGETYVRQDDLRLWKEIMRRDKLEEWALPL